MGTLEFASRTTEVNHDFDTYVAGGFAPFPVAIIGANGSTAYDVDGKPYIDFLSMIAVNNMGHGHPNIIDASIKAIRQGATVNLSVQSPYYGKLAKRMSEMFGYERFVALKSGGEAADAAIKVARKWGHLVNGIPLDRSHILSTSSCYHGVGLSTLSLFSTKSTLFGPFLPNTGSVSPSGCTVRFGNLEDVERVFKKDGKQISAFILEPIQGASGVVVPPDNYLPGVAKLCKDYHVLLILDEIQTGLGRCGYPLYHHKFGVRPDLVIVGKALAGGVYPMSGVTGDTKVMGLLDPYQVGSTMAANPPGCAAALAALDVLEEENLAARAHEMGDLLISTLKSLNPPHVKQYMGDGLLWAIVMQERPPLVTSRRVVPLLAQRGLLANAIKGGRIRICPPLNIDRDLLIKGAEVIVKALVDIESHPQGIPGESVVIRYPQFMQ